ncbi:hypothetical protein D3C72_1794790 [compost metagenome]
MQLLRGRWLCRCTALVAREPAGAQTAHAMQQHQARTQQRQLRAAPAPHQAPGKQGKQQGQREIVDPWRPAVGWRTGRAKLAHGLLQVIIARVGLSGEPYPHQQPEGDQQATAEQKAVEGFHTADSFHGTVSVKAYSTGLRRSWARNSARFFRGQGLQRWQ